MQDSNSALLIDIRSLVQHRLIPLESQFLRHGFRATLPALGAIRKVVKASGWWAPYLPSEAGGMGLSLTHFAEVSEQLGRTPLGHYAFNCQARMLATSNCCCPGSPEQKAISSPSPGEIRTFRDDRARPGRIEQPGSTQPPGATAITTSSTAASGSPAVRTAPPSPLSWP
jgi:hypothetical protein